MGNMTTINAGTTATTCTCCSGPLERVRYFPRQLIAAEDMRAEQHYLRERMKRHNLFLHGWGVVCGCNVVPDPNNAPWGVLVCPGYVVGPQGDEILVPTATSFHLQLGAQNQDPCTPAWPCPPQPVGATTSQQQIGYLAIRYTECVTRPVRVHPAGCGCDQLDCEYSRIRDSFELKLLWAIPTSHTEALAWDRSWRATLSKNRDQIRELGPPVPPCMPCVEDPWVVLAAITIPTTQGQTPGAGPTPSPIQTDDINTNARRVLLSTNAMQGLFAFI
jgi:hypothetical protein